MAYSDVQSATEVLQLFGNFIKNYNSKWTSLLPKTPELVFQPIGIETTPAESISIFQLIRSNNVELKKIVIVFTTLACEAKKIFKTYKEEVLPSVVKYSKIGGPGLRVRSHSVPLLHISQFLPALSKASWYLRSARTLVIEIMYQLNGFYKLAKVSKTMSASEIHLPDMLNCAGQLLFSLFNLNLAIYDDPQLLPDLDLLIKAVETRKYPINVPKLTFLEDKETREEFLGMLRLLKDTLADPVNFAAFTAEGEEPFNTSFITEVKNYIQQRTNDLEKIKENYPDGQDTLSIVIALLAFYSHVFGIHDSSLFNPIRKISTYRFVDLIAVDGSCVFWIRKFMYDVFRTYFKDKSLKEGASKDFRPTHPSVIKTKLEKSHTKFYQEAKTWVLNMDCIMTKELTNSLKVEEMNTMTSLLLEGLECCRRARDAAANLSNFHVFTNQPMTEDGVMVLCETVEIVKVMRETYMRHSAAIARSLVHLLQRAMLHILTLLTRVEVSIRKTNKKDLQKVVDCLSALEMAQRCLAGPVTTERVTAARIAISLAGQRNTFRLEELKELTKLLHQIQTLSQLSTEIDNATNCDFLFRCLACFPTYIHNLINKRSDSSSLRYLLEASGDCLNDIKDPESRAQELEILRTTMVDYPCKMGLMELDASAEVETCVRYLAHSHNKSSEPWPKKLSEVPLDPSPLLEVPPFHHLDSVYDIKGQVGDTLDEKFYTLTAINPNMCRIYSKMRCIAMENFDIPTVEEDQLPSMTSNQGRDIINIARDLPKFCTEHRYHMNDQLFVKAEQGKGRGQEERGPKVVVTTEHAQNSLRQHGTGILRATINAAYQYLKSELKDVFIKIVFNNVVKIYALREVSYFKDYKKSDMESMYPFDRASSLESTLRGTLTSLQASITKMGNVLGLVRTMTAGSLRCRSVATHHLPPAAAAAAPTPPSALSDSTAAATAAFDATVRLMHRSDMSFVEYLKQIQAVLLPKLRDEQFELLRKFYILVPALTLHFCRESRKFKNSSYAFYDDGFFMGLVFVLSMADCNSEFESLNWFDSVEKHYAGMLEEFRRQRIADSDKSLIHALDMSVNQTTACQKEFRLCRCLFTTAKVFFREYKKKTDMKTE